MGFARLRRSQVAAAGKQRAASRAASAGTPAKGKSGRGWACWPPASEPREGHDYTQQPPRYGQSTGTTILIRNNQRRRRGGGNTGPRPQQMAGGNNYGARLDNRQRGNATQLLEKYRALARDAQQAGDRVTAEYYLQYAEHYFRILGDHRDRQPEGRNGRDAYDDDGVDGDSGNAESDDDRGDDGDQRRDERARDDRPRDDRPRDDRERGRRDDRNRDGRTRDDRPRDDRPRDERPRDERPREDRPRQERPFEDRGADGNRRDWQRDRRDRRPERSEQPRDQDSTDAPAIDDRESFLQALPPPVSRGEGPRLSVRRDAEEAPAAPAPAESVAAEAAPTEKPVRRRTRKPAAETESAD
ncbi:DUF4167 domain-containing protein [Sandarakinorhabdus limnophila]|uniref:DUF4167 domain-containing protein n=1 Tax=Sandarakinorhabdus limnophila TaxID=210512 RepID=UPI0026EDB64E|nr:DUF4167 domain-containing protein [Sandarakinorhabdus limnophila]